MTSRSICASLVLCLLAPGGAAAQATAVEAREHRTSPGVAPESAPAPLTSGASQAGGERPPSVYDRIWRFTRWYEDESNPVVQRILFSGRYQHEFAAIESEQGDLNEWNVRRMRLGPRVTLFRDFTAHAEIELNPQEADPLYVRFTDAYLQWSHSARFNLTVGKQGVPFTMDGSTSSKDLLTIDRSNLSNNLWFPQEYMPGVSIFGRRGAWLYRTGIYSSGESNREFGEFNGGVFALWSAGYDLAPRLGAREALLSGQYVYQHADADNTFTRQLEHIASLNYRYEAARWGFRADVSGGKGYLGQGDLWGVMAMPFMNVTDRLQLVGRYTLVGSAAANGVRLTTYESRITPLRGDRYDELYAGINYFFYGHRLKLQSGLQFASLHDRTDGGDAYDGVSWTTGLRVSW